MSDTEQTDENKRGSVKELRKRFEQQAKNKQAGHQRKTSLAEVPNSDDSARERSGSVLGANANVSSIIKQYQDKIEKSQTKKTLPAKNNPDASTVKGDEASKKPFVPNIENIKLGKQNYKIGAKDDGLRITSPDKAKTSATGESQESNAVTQIKDIENREQPEAVPERNKDEKEHEIGSVTSEYNNSSQSKHNEGNQEQLELANPEVNSKQEEESNPQTHEEHQTHQAEAEQIEQSQDEQVIDDPNTGENTQTAADHQAPDQELLDDSASEEHREEVKIKQDDESTKNQGSDQTNQVFQNPFIDREAEQQTTNNVHDNEGRSEVTLDNHTESPNQAQKVARVEEKDTEVAKQESFSPEPNSEKEGAITEENSAVGLTQSQLITTTHSKKPTNYEHLSVGTHSKTNPEGRKQAVSPQEQHSAVSADLFDRKDVVTGRRRSTYAEAFPDLESARNDRNIKSPKTCYEKCIQWWSDIKDKTASVFNLQVRKPNYSKFDVEDNDRSVERLD